MSKRKRALERQKKQNSPAKKAKIAKKQSYKSWDSAEKWEEKKRRKSESNINRRISDGISTECPLKHFEKPSAENCEGCELKCSSKYQ